MVRLPSSFMRAPRDECRERQGLSHYHLRNSPRSTGRSRQLLQNTLEIPDPLLTVLRRDGGALTTSFASARDVSYKARVWGGGDSTSWISRIPVNVISITRSCRPSLSLSLFLALAMYRAESPRDEQPRQGNGQAPQKIITGIPRTLVNERRVATAYSHSFLLVFSSSALISS